MLYYTNNYPYNKQQSHDSTFRDFLQLIAHKTGYEPKQSGRCYLGCCPAHDDNHPSLSISEGNDGRILIYCHCGCTYREICEALGIPVSNLFQKNRAGGYRG
jgi:hypothetical protein